MERKRVNSSKLRSIGYDEKTRTLEVEMANGQIFQYGGVYPEVYRRFIVSLAERVAEAHREGVLGVTGERVSEAEREAIEKIKAAAGASE